MIAFTDMPPEDAVIKAVTEVNVACQQSPSRIPRNSFPGADMQANLRETPSGKLGIQGSGIEFACQRIRCAVTVGCDFRRNLQ
jgi:hypothetical protein